MAYDGVEEEILQDFIVEASEIIEAFRNYRDPERAAGSAGRKS